MFARHRLSKWKPPIGAVINQAHPLAAGLFDCLLFNEGGGQRVANLANPRFGATGTASPSWKPTVGGLAAYCTGGSSFDVADHGNAAAGLLTLRVVMLPDTWPGLTAIVDKANPTRELSFFADASGNITFVAIGGNEGGQTITTGMTAGSLWDFVVVRSSLSAVLSFYVNGVLKATSSSIFGGTAAQAGSVLGIGRNPSAGGVAFNGKYISVQIWRRALTASEIMGLYRAPYSFLMSPPRQTPKAMAGGNFFYQRYIAERARA